MRIKRWIAALAALAVLLGCGAMAENADAAVPSPTPAPIYAPMDISPEEVRLFVETLFSAAIGTTAEQEELLRDAIKEQCKGDKEREKAELDARNAETAIYRARTLPWLIAVFRPEILLSEFLASPAPTPAPTPVPTPETAPAMAELPAYTSWDSYAAFSETDTGREYLNLLASMDCFDRETALLLTQEICRMWMEQVDHQKLASMNRDYECWIYSPFTQIDYPVVQCGDNGTYLSRMFNGDRNSAGTLFIDYRNLSDFRDPNTLIYGHHMRNDSMFGTLTDYEDQYYFEGHPFILVMAEEDVFLLEVFAGYTTSARDHCYDIAISDEEDMARFIEEAAEKSDFVSSVLVQTTDRLVTLSTCAYAFENARYILIGRIVPVWNEILWEALLEEDLLLQEALAAACE